MLHYVVWRLSQFIHLARVLKSNCDLLCPFSLSVCCWGLLRSIQARMESNRHEFQSRREQEEWGRSTHGMGSVEHCCFPSYCYGPYPALGAPPLTAKQEIVTNPPLTSAGQWTVGLDSKGLMFLLAKQLSPSGVSSLGRIVLPKREAEAHLPHLVASEGVLLTMTDYDTRQSWIFRYRFWSNNKSRMYLLENTRDFVKAHNLQERDTLVLYKDADGSYVVRGEKNGASQCPKCETSPHEAPTIEEEISRKQQTLEFLI